MTNKNIRNINRTLAKITSKMPVNIMVTKKPSKLETAISIVAGIACYAYGIGMMLKASEPCVVTMPAFTFPGLTPETTDEEAPTGKAAEVLALAENLVQSPYAFVTGYCDDVRSISISWKQSGTLETRTIHLYGYAHLGWKSPETGEWQYLTDKATYNKIRDRLLALKKEVGGYYMTRRDKELINE